MVLHGTNFAYSAFLSIFPLILIVLSAIGFIFSSNPAAMQSVLDAVSKAVPQLELVMKTVADSLIQWRGLAGVVGIIALLLSMRKLVFSVRKGFRQIWGTEKLGFVKKNLIGIMGSLIMVLVVIAIFVMTYLTSQAISWLSQRVGAIASSFFLLLGMLISAAMFVVLLAVLYRTVPEDKPGLKEALWGGLFAGASIEIFTYVFNIYLSKVSKTQAIYGSVGVVLGLLLWLYFTGLMIFFGAEVVKVLQDRWAQPSREQQASAEGY